MASYDFERGELDSLDIISFISLLVGFQNLDLNQKQVDGIMSELKDYQNNALDIIIKQNEEIIELNKEIIKLLKEKDL